MRTIALLSLAALSVSLVYLSHINVEQEYAVKLEKIAKQVNSAGSTWIASSNISERNIDEEKLKMMNGALTPKMILPLKEVEPAGLMLPIEFDSRKAWPSCKTIGETRDQSMCGSCWAFSTASVMSDRICIHSGEKIHKRVSSTDLLTCCHDCGNGCQGGWIESAFDYWVRSGVTTGGSYKDYSMCKSYPFPPCAHHVPASEKYDSCEHKVFPTPACSSACDNESELDIANERVFGSSSYRLNGHENIANEIMRNGPVAAAFTVYEDFYTYKSGVYQYVSGKYLGNHAIKIIGFGVENDTPYWLIVNSWNESWGEQGLFKILRGSDHCGIESMAAAAVPRL